MKKTKLLVVCFAVLFLASSVMAIQEPSGGGINAESGAQTQFFNSLGAVSFVSIVLGVILIIAGGAFHFFRWGRKKTALILLICGGVLVAIATVASVLVQIIAFL